MHPNAALIRQLQNNCHKVTLALKNGRWWASEGSGVQHAQIIPKGAAVPVSDDYVDNEEWRCIRVG